MDQDKPRRRYSGGVDNSGRWCGWCRLRSLCCHSGVAASDDAVGVITVVAGLSAVGRIAAWVTCLDAGDPGCSSPDDLFRVVPLAVPAGAGGQVETASPAAPAALMASETLV